MAFIRRPGRAGFITACLLCAKVAIAAGPGSVTVGHVSGGQPAAITRVSVEPADFLSLLRADKRCYKSGRVVIPRNPACKHSLLTALAVQDKPSDALLRESLNWYWAGKRRISADEVMQHRLFNQLHQPLFDVILMEKRYLQSVEEFTGIQYRIDPEARYQWRIPTQENYQSIEELFHLAYDLPAGERAYSSGYIHRDRVFGSDELRRLDTRTDLNRLIGHILGFIGEDRTSAARKSEARIPNNPEFWKTLRAFQRLLANTGYNWAEISRPIENRLGQLSQLYRQWLALTPAVDDLIRVGAGKTFVEYIHYKNTQTGLEHYAAFTVTTGQPAAAVHFADLGSAANINQRIVALRRAILQKAPVGKLQQQLTEALIKPLSIDFGKTEELVISPAASLNSLPFALLVQTGSADGVEISYSDSWSILIQAFSRQMHLDQPVVTTPGIILADPDYGGDLKMVSADLDIAGQERQGSDAWPRFFTPLAYTAQEGRAIARLSPDKVILLSGNKASEFALFERNNPKFIHIASHGYFLSDAWQRRDQWPIYYRNLRGSLTLRAPQILPRLDSGLALAGANQLIAGTQVRAFQPDGLFTASDAASLNLLGTELVVLSACNTGLGEAGDQADRTSVGDGVTNLRSAFRQAGAKNVIMSLWPVADKTTWWLMEEFYQSWFSGASPKKALRQAKTQLRKRLQEDGMSDHPYYWAGFVIQSEF